MNLSGMPKDTARKQAEYSNCMCQKASFFIIRRAFAIREPSTLVSVRYVNILRFPALYVNAGFNI